MWGEYCCKTEWEGTAENNLAACDGGLISINSICCEDNQYDKCPNMVGCKNNRGIQNWSGNTKISHFIRNMYMYMVPSNLIFAFQ